MGKRLYNVNGTLCVTTLLGGVLIDKLPGNPTIECGQDLQCAQIVDNSSFLVPIVQWTITAAKAKEKLDQIVTAE